MKTSTWQGFHSASRLARLLAWLSRGEIPVDGFTHVEARAPGHDESLGNELDRCVREAEDAGLISRAPVRWGNFR